MPLAICKLLLFSYIHNFKPPGPLASYRFNFMVKLFDIPEGDPAAESSPEDDARVQRGHT